MPSPRSLPRSRRGLSPSSKAVRQEPLRHLVEIGGEASAIDRDPETAAIREMADQVAPAQRDRVERQPARGAIDEPLDQVIGFGLAGAAIGIDRHRVGEDAAHRHEHGRDVVDPAHGAGRRIGRAARAVGRQIGAEIGHRVDIEGEKPAVAVERQARRAYDCRGLARS